MLKKPCLKFQNRQHRFLEIFKAAVIQKPIFRSRPEEISPLTQFLIIFNNDDLRRKNSYQETGVHCPPLAGPLPLVSSADMQSWGTSHDDDNDVIMTVVVMVMMVVVVSLAMVMILVVDLQLIWWRAILGHRPWWCWWRWRWAGAGGWWWWLDDGDGVDREELLELLSYVSSVRTQSSQYWITILAIKIIKHFSSSTKDHLAPCQLVTRQQIERPEKSLSIH